MHGSLADKLIGAAVRDQKPEERQLGIVDLQMKFTVAWGNMISDRYVTESDL